MAELTLRFSERASAQTRCAIRRIGIPRAASSSAVRFASSLAGRARARAREGRSAGSFLRTFRRTFVSRSFGERRKRRARIIRERAMERIINGAGARKCVKRLRKVQIMRARLFPIAFNR